MPSEVLDLVYDRVRRLAEPGDFAAFDFDNTCIYNDIGEAVFVYQCENGLLRNRYLLGRERGLDGTHITEMFSANFVS